MDKTTTSKNGIAIRLTEERWKHIYIMHPNLAEKQEEILSTVKHPDHILKGKAGELLAVVGTSKRAYLVVVYKETASVDNGFIITAFETTDTTWLFKKEKIWSKHL